MQPVHWMSMPRMFKNRNFKNLSPMPTRYYEPFMLDGGSMKSEGTSILLWEHQQDTILWGHETGLELALKSSHCQPMKTIKPAVEKLHCCTTEVDSIQCFANSPLTWPNSWLLPKHPTNWFVTWDLKQLRQFFTLYIFLASKNSISQQQHSVNMLEKQIYYYTLLQGFMKINKKSEYMSEVRTIGL